MGDFPLEIVENVYAKRDRLALVSGWGMADFFLRMDHDTKKIQGGHDLFFFFLTFLVGAKINILFFKKLSSPTPPPCMCNSAPLLKQIVKSRPILLNAIFFYNGKVMYTQLFTASNQENPIIIISAENQWINNIFRYTLQCRFANYRLCQKKKTYNGIFICRK